MSAEPSPRNKRRGLIEEFTEKYAAALTEAEISAAHTSTEGWKRLYAGFRNQQRETRRELAKELKHLSTRMEDVGLSDDEEKTLGGIKKSSEDVNDAKTRFELNTVEPVRRPMVDCENLITEVMYTAQRRESEAPLVEVGLVETVKMAVADLPRPRWNEDEGRLEIVKPK